MTTPTSNAPDDGAWTYDQLVEAEGAGRRLKFLFFWGHTPPPSGEIGAHVLSQWYLHEFEADEVTYASAEHYMMADKARLFADDEALEEILTAATPGEAKALGRGVRDFDNAAWEAHRSDIVTRASVAKFGSNEELRSYLVETGNRVLVEASPRDRIWGIGMGKNNPAAEQPSAWRGLNLLGFALMRARAELRRHA
ncbi:MAG: NADAR family protein [Actinomycetia bacterium]|nr:NADAR family protein [Actinomycetes bacterium]MCP4960349.1 NADAR family protein [Actinomycetes bacterium]